MLLAEITEAAITGGSASLPLLIYILLDRTGAFSKKNGRRNSNPGNSMIEQVKEDATYKAEQKALHENLVDSVNGLDGSIDKLRGLSHKQLNVLERIQEGIDKLVRRE